MEKLTFVKFKCWGFGLDDVYYVGRNLASIMSDTRSHSWSNGGEQTHIRIDDLGCFCIGFASFQELKKASVKEIRAAAPKEFDKAIGRMRSGIYSSCQINVPKQLLEYGTTIVQMGGWNRGRVLMYRPDHIRLQVTLFDCSNCSTCIERVKELKEFLATEGNVGHQWEYKEGVWWLVLKRQPEEKPLTILRNVLKVKVKPKE